MILPNTAQENNMFNTQNNFSISDFGKISPYPTDIIVTVT
jgi:hypothetical protein